MYVTVQQPQLKAMETGTQAVADVFKPVMKSSLQYKNIKPAASDSGERVKVPEVNEQWIDDVKKKLQNYDLLPVVIGNGKKIVQQLPQVGEKVMKDQKIVLLTDGAMTMPDMTNWSKKDVLKVSEITGIPFQIQGSGYVTEQNVATGSPIDDRSLIKLKLDSPLKISDFHENNDQMDDTAKSSSIGIDDNESIGELLAR